MCIILTLKWIWFYPSQILVRYLSIPLTDQTLITAGRDLEQSQRLPYNYVPSFDAGIVFLVLFGLSTGEPDLKHQCSKFLTICEPASVIHVVQTFRYKMWWLLPTVFLGGVGELIGWAARTWSHSSPYLINPFIMQCVIYSSPLKSLLIKLFQNDIHDH